MLSRRISHTKSGKVKTKAGVYHPQQSSHFPMTVPGPLGHDGFRTLPKLTCDRIVREGEAMVSSESGEKTRLENIGKQAKNAKENK